MSDTEHPVIRALRETTKLRPADVDFIVQHGHSYRGATLPAGVKRWPLGECIVGAADFEERGFGRFVRGFTLRPGERKPIPHAWASPDDVRAYDPTLPDSRSNLYWGLPAQRHHDRLTDMSARGFRGATSAGLPVDLMRGGLKIPGLRPFRVM
jgi:hypothetical protein